MIFAIATDAGATLVAMEILIFGLIVQINAYCCAIIECRTQDSMILEIFNRGRNLIFRWQLRQYMQLWKKLWMESRRFE